MSSWSVAAQRKVGQSHGRHWRRSSSLSAMRAMVPVARDVQPGKLHRIASAYRLGIVLEERPSCTGGESARFGFIFDTAGFVGPKCDLNLASRSELSLERVRELAIFNSFTFPIPRPPRTLVKAAFAAFCTSLRSTPGCKNAWKLTKWKYSGDASP